MNSIIIYLVVFEAIVLGALSWAWVTRALPVITEAEAARKRQAEALKQAAEALNPYRTLTDDELIMGVDPYRKAAS